jgi:hypothetical protein
VSGIVVFKYRDIETFILLSFFGSIQLIYQQLFLKNLMFELQINAQACIIGCAFVFAGVRTPLCEGHKPWHTQYYIV